MNNKIKWKDYLIYQEYGGIFNKNKLKEKLITDISKQNIKYDENIMIKSFIYYIILISLIDYNLLEYILDGLHKNHFHILILMIHNLHLSYSIH